MAFHLSRWIPAAPARKRRSQSIDGIRLTFHEHEIEAALSLGRELQEKGYKIFMQPVGTMTYPDETRNIIVDILCNQFRTQIPCAPAYPIYRRIYNNLTPRLAPGKSIHQNTDRLSQLIRENKYFAVSVNFIPEQIPIDAVFNWDGSHWWTLCNTQRHIPMNIAFAKVWHSGR